MHTETQENQIVINSNNISRFSKRLKKAISEELKQELPLNQSQELLAKSLGANSWHALITILRKQELNKMDVHQNKFKNDLHNQKSNFEKLLLNFQTKEHSGYTLDDFQKILIFCHEEKVDNLTLRPHEPIYIKKNGIIHKLSQHPLCNSEMEMLGCALYGATSFVSIIKGGRDIDGAYQIKINQKYSVRYLFNINPLQIQQEDESTTNFEISLKTVLEINEKLIDYGIENFDLPENGGLLLVNSYNKNELSKLSRAILKNLIENEYNLHFGIYTDTGLNIENTNTNIVSQTLVPRHISGYAQGLRNAQRRNFDVIMIGEISDIEIMDEALSTASTGSFVIAKVSNAILPNTLSLIENKLNGTRLWWGLIEHHLNKKTNYLQWNTNASNGVKHVKEPLEYGNYLLHPDSVASYTAK